MFFSKKQGFTLIELLVVLGIISLFASIALAQLNSARDKGSLGAAKSFSQSVEHGLGAETIGIWRIDEGSGTTITEVAAGRNGTLVAGSPSCNGGIQGSGLLPTWNGSDKIKGNWAIQINGGGGCFTQGSGIVIPDGPAESPLEFKTSNFTIAMWVKTNNTSGGIYYTLASKRSGGQRGWTIEMGSNSLAFRCNITAPYDDDCAAEAPSSSIPIADGKWHYIVVSRNGTKISYYFDGKNAGGWTSPSVIDFANNNSQLKFGADGDGAVFSLVGLLDDIHIYSQAVNQ